MDAFQRILLVDDEAAILFAFSQFLKAPGVMIDSAETVEKAVGLITSNDYRAAVVDLRLTGATSMEGCDIIRLIKQRRPSTTIVVVTAYGGEEIRETVVRLGADFYFEKPISPKVIRETLKNRGVYTFS
jgi:DNA-binding response OmpR family regulator